MWRHIANWLGRLPHDNKVVISVLGPSSPLNSFSKTLHFTLFQLTQLVKKEIKWVCHPESVAMYAPWKPGNQPYEFLWVKKDLYRMNCGEICKVPHYQKWVNLVPMTQIHIHEANYSLFPHIRQFRKDACVCACVLVNNYYFTNIN